MTIPWSRFVDLVGSHQRFLLTSHKRPDCDALGSELGMAGVLEFLGKEVAIVNADEIPDHLRFIDPAGKTKTLAETPPETIAQAEVILVLDTSSWLQLGAMADVIRGSGAKRAVIDHHVSQDDFEGEVFKDSTAEATGRLVVEAADALGVPLNRPIAEALYTAMATDTGWFRFASVSAITYHVAARLIDAGAQPAALYRNLYEQESLARVHLRGHILSAAVSDLDGRLIYAVVTQEDFARCHATPTDTEDAINLLLRVAETEAAFLALEFPGNTVKASFRSRNGVDVRAIAEQFGGGGHTMAAGATLQGPLSSALEAILDAVRKAMR